MATNESCTTSSAVSASRDEQHRQPHQPRGSARRTAARPRRRRPTHARGTAIAPSLRARPPAGAACRSFTLVPRASLAVGFTRGRTFPRLELRRMATDADCLFCKIVAGDIPADVVHETDTTLAFRDLEPQAPTHVLVIPRSHQPNAAALAAAEPDAARRPRQPRPRRWPTQEGLGEGYRLVFNTGAGARTRRSSTPTCTCSAAARWAGPGMSPPRLVRRCRGSSLLAAARCGRRACSGSADRLRHDGPGPRRHDSTGAEPTPPRTTAGHGDAAAPAAASRCEPGSGWSGWRCPSPTRRRRRTAPAPTTTAASCSTRTWPRTPSSPASTSCPGNPDGRAPRDPVPGAARRGRRASRPRTTPEKGEGWTCFGGTGVEARRRRSTTPPWLGAWAPGGGEQVMAEDVGIPLAKGIAGDHAGALQPARRHRARRQLRAAAAGAGRRSSSPPLETMLLPAPVELPCRPATTRPAVRPRRRGRRTPRSAFGDDAGLAARLPPPALRRR